MTATDAPAKVPKPKKERDPEKVANARGGPPCRTCGGFRPYLSGVTCPLCVPRTLTNR